MKKLTILGMAFLIVGILGVFAPVSAHASSLPASQVLGINTASLLNQTLDAMQVLLDIMRVRFADTVNPLTVDQKIAFNGVLGGIETNLIGISATVASLEQKAIATESVKAPVVAVIPVEGTSIIAQNPTEAIQESVGAGSEALAPTDDIRTASDNDVAAVGVSARMKGVLWGLLAVLIVVIAGAFFFRSHDAEESGHTASTGPGTVYELSKMDEVNEILAQDIPNGESEPQVQDMERTAPLPMA
jgi:hypothetical protein